MIGSAAARHLARQTEGVAPIGPDELAVRADHHDVFGSHYDEGCIHRILDSADLGAIGRQTNPPPSWDWILHLDVIALTS